MEERKFETFPATRSQALAMLYLQQQDLSKLTPTQLYLEYKRVYSEICDAAKK